MIQHFARLAPGSTRVVGALLLSVAVAGCSGSADATESVERACAAFQEADQQTVETVGPFLETMVAEAAAAALADSTYEDFAYATLVLRNLVSNTAEPTEEELDAEFDELIAALEVVEATCNPS